MDNAYWVNDLISDLQNGNFEPNSLSPHEWEVNCRGVHVFPVEGETNMVEYEGGLIGYGMMYVSDQIIQKIKEKCNK